ncbi:MAG: hypothetical protein GKR89_19550 [Candidatus Latescibacteria bacterium]|nr:hypothetical protein [Candidatus Latescibacterota bacterium]
MRIGLHMGYGTAAEITTKCTQAGVGDIFLGAGSVPGFADNGYMHSDPVVALGQELNEEAIAISGIILPPPSQEVILGQDAEGRAHLCQTIRAAGQAGIDTALFYPLDRLLHFTDYHPGRPLQVMPGDDAWPQVIEFMREVVGAADQVGLRLANHLWAVDVVHALWEAAPSPNNGVTYCQGMSLFGEDAHTPAQTWGMERIFFAHARNQAQYGPALRDHDEVPLDSGDVDIPRCVHALLEADYQGVIIPEHLGPQSEAEAVVYLKGLIEA